MTTIAAGTYLYLVRDLVSKVRLQDVATHISIATGTPITWQEVRGIERGNPTTAAILAAFVEAIQADASHVMTLLDHDAPTDAEIGVLVRTIRDRSPRPIYPGRKPPRDQS